MAVMWLTWIISTLLGIRSLLKCQDKLRRVGDDILIPPVGLTYHGNVAVRRFIISLLAVLLVGLLLLLRGVLLLVQVVAVVVLRLDDGAGVREVRDGVGGGEERVGRCETGLVGKCQIVLVLRLVDRGPHTGGVGGVGGEVPQGAQAGAEGRLVGLAGRQPGAVLDQTGAGGGVTVGRLQRLSLVGQSQTWLDQSPQTVGMVDRSLHRFGLTSVLKISR